MAALETMAVPTIKQAKESKNWAETEAEHEARLRDFYSRLPEAMRWRHTISLGGIEHGYVRNHELHDYRHGLEANHRFSLANKTRYKAVPKCFTRNHHDYWDSGDALRKLAVKLVDGIFHPMTFGEYLWTIRQTIIMANNNDAHDTIERWKHHPFGPYTLMQPDSLDLHTPNDRLTTRAECWGTDRARLLRDPRFEATQDHGGCKAVTVTFYDGNKKIMSFPAEHHWPGESEQNGFVFMPCPEKLLGQHLVSRRHTLPKIDDFCGVNVDGMKTALPLLRKAVSNDNSRPILTYICLRQQPHTLDMVATDTYRLTLADTEASGTTHLQDILVQPGALMAALENFSGEIVMGWDDKNVYFSDDYVTGISIPREDGQFVNYPKVIPSSHQHEITFDCKALTAAIKELMPVAREDSNRIILRADKNGTKLMASNRGEWDDETRNYKGQHAETHIPSAVLHSSDSLEVEIGFNGRFVLDFIEKMKGEVTLELSGPLNSFCWKPTDNRHLLSVQMPMQIM